MKTLLAWLLFPTVVFAPMVALHWIPNGSIEEVTSYAVYVGDYPGVPREFHTRIPVGSVTNYLLRFTNRVRVAVSAVNSWAIEGELSNEITVPPTNRPPAPYLPFPPVPNPPWTNLQATVEQAVEINGPWRRVVAVLPQTNAASLFWRIVFVDEP